MTLNRNKLLCLCLCAVLALSAAAPLRVFAEEESTVVYGQTAYGLLNALEITAYEQENLTAQITRGEMLALFCRAAGYSGTVNKESVFSDMPVEHEYESYVRTLADLGVVTPSRDGRIFPDGGITLIEAAAVAVKLIGYGVPAEERGGYPSGYLRTTKSCGLLDMLPAEQSAIMTKGMAAQLLVNMLEADAMIQVGFGENQKFRREDGHTLLYDVFHVRHLTGVLDNVDLTRLMGLNDVMPFHIEMGDITIETRAIEDIYSYLGYEVKLYYAESRRDEEKLVYIAKTDRNREYVLDVDDIDELNDNAVTYIDPDSGRIKRYTFKRGVPVVYNGTSTGMTIAELGILEKYGRLRLLDNDGNGGIDVIFADIYDNYVVSYVDADTMTVYSKNGMGNIVLNNTIDEPYTVIYGTDGKEGDVSKVAVGNVLSVFQSADDAYQKYIRAYAVNTSAAGLIELRRSDSKVTIGGIEYEATEQCVNLCKSLLAPGRSVTLSLDYFGKVAWAERFEAGAMRYGLLVAQTESGVFDPALRIRIYSLENENFEEYDTAQNLRIDDVSYRNNKDGALARLRAASAAIYSDASANGILSLIRFSVNSDGAVSVIDTVLNKDGSLATRESEASATDILFRALSRGTYRSLNGTYSFGGQIALNTTSRIVYHPPVNRTLSLSDLSNYMVGAVNSLMNDSQVTAIGYYSNPRSSIADVMTIGYDLGTAIGRLGYSVKFAVVDELLEQWNEETQNAETVVNVQWGDSSYTLSMRESFEGVHKSSNGIIPVTDLKKGDVVRFNRDAKGYVNYMELNFRASTQELCYSYNTASREAVTSIRTGFVYDTLETGYLVYFTTDRIAENPADVLANVKAEDCELVLSPTNNPYYYSYEKVEGKEPIISVSNEKAVKSYKDTGNDCSRVLIHEYYGTPYGVLIY